MLLHHLTVNAGDDVNILDRVDPWVSGHTNEDLLLFVEVRDSQAASIKRDHLKDYLFILDQ